MALGEKYCWKAGGYHPKANANKVGKEIESLDEVKPENIVNFARDKKTELHKCFEWNDGIAAENYRRQQAAAIMNNLVFVVRKDVNSPAKEVKAYVNTQKNQEYKPIDYVLHSPTEYQKMLDKAIRDLQSTRNKYAEIAELQDLYELIDEKAEEFLV